MTLRWFLSKTVRQLSEMCRQMKRLVNEQRDLLSTEAIAGLEAARAEALEAIQSGAKKPELKRQMGKLEEAARKWSRQYGSPAIRENVKEFLVAVVTILSFTTFFLQLTKIPTGSMQPTLYGITYQDLSQEKDVQIPPFWKRFLIYWTQGISYKHLEAPFDGFVAQVGPPKAIFPFVKRQPVVFTDAMGSVKKTMWVWFPPDDRLFAPGNPGSVILSGRMFRKGESIVKAKAIAGDHLLVDRFTYNFRKPKRGEIFVFKTKGIGGLPPDVLYIKRLVALPNDHVQIGNDRHLIINGEKLTAATPRFERVYEFEFLTNSPYMGHVNGVAAEKLGMAGGSLAPLFLDESMVRRLGPRQYLAMGDNTTNSYDSRAWGEVPQENVIGKCWFVYWPFTERFGWGYR
jgi:signal peptidase I